MNALVRSFFQGCLVLVPTVVTGYVVYTVLVRVDRLFASSVPGLGVVLCLAATTAVGALVSNVIGRTVLRLSERAISRVPLVRLLYSTLRDLMGAIVGEQRGFDRPVVVALDDAGELLALGFVTQDDLGEFGLAGHVAVYFPQAYNIAGHTVVVPRARVRSLDVNPARVMALVVSGGITKGREPNA